jgi:hypothetical protein
MQEKNSKKLGHKAEGILDRTTVQRRTIDSNALFTCIYMHGIPYSWVSTVHSCQVPNIQVSTDLNRKRIQRSSRSAGPCAAAGLLPAGLFSPAVRLVGA